MTTRSAFSPLAALNTDAIRNVFLYICDALRWDYRPDGATSQGVTLRTAVHGLYTPPAITSLMTGCYPPRHGATRFGAVLPPDCDTVFDIAGTVSSFRHNQWDAHPVFDLLGQSKGSYIDAVEPPFVYVEHDHGAHAPYPNLDADVREVFSRLSGDPSAHRSHYREGIDASINRFHRRLSILEERGLREETLVIFTSDHGELLGEYGGFVGHSLPATPELVYVPTVFIHPSLTNATYDAAMIEQVDLLPTVRAALAAPPPSDTSYDGRSLLDTPPRDRRAYNHGIIYFPGDHRLTRLLDPIYHARSVWTEGGGHVFVQSNLAKRVLTGIYDASRSAETGSYNRTLSHLTALRRLLPMYIPATQTFGTPTLSQPDAREYCNAIATGSSDASGLELSEETRERLKDLGYQ